MSKALLAAVFVLAAALCVATLVSGGAVVTELLPGGLPIGNVLAWFVFLGLATAALLLAAHGSLVRSTAWAALALSIAWLPLSTLFAGNLSLNFSGEAGAHWLAASAGLFALAVLALLVAAASAIIRHFKSAGSA